MADTEGALGPPLAARAQPNTSVDRRALFDAHYSFIWRVVRRLGASGDSVDDITQQVFMTAFVKLEHIEVGKERAFLFATAVRIAANERRRRRLPRSDAPPEAVVDSQASTPEEELERSRRRALLDQILEQLSQEHRAVLVLHELEGMTMAEIAGVLDVAPGTVASRLRRAREQFERHVARLRHGHGMRKELP